MSPELVSIVIPTSNGKHLLGECLTSVFLLKSVVFEVIVVDNGSADGSVGFLRQKFPLVRLLEIPDRIGFSKAINLGIQASKGQYIATLNNDTVVTDTWLLELLLALKADPSAGFCATKILFHHDSTLIDTAGDAFTTAGFPYKRGFRQNAADNFNDREYVFGACAAAALFRREVFETVGLFDEDFFAFNEDVDLSFRAQLHGFRCLYVPSAIIYHRGRATFGKQAGWDVYLGYRNLVAVVVKNLPRRLLLRFFPSILLRWCLTLVTRTLKGQGGLLLGALWEALRSLPLMMRKRREIQGTRTVDPAYIRSILDGHWIKAMIRLSGPAHRIANPPKPLPLPVSEKHSGQVG